MKTIFAIPLLLHCSFMMVAQSRQLVTNGVPVAPGTYPFFTFNKFGNNAGCGASLIHRDILLTAAHCRTVFDGRGAYVGATTNFGVDDGEFHEDEAALRHPEYRAADFANDVMLVKLETSTLLAPIPFNRHPLKPLLDSNLTVMGFGDTEFQGDLSETLLETHVFASDFEECAALYFNESEAVLNETTQFCALGEEGRDACQADSGGPIIGLDVNGDTQQIGIISFGLGCGKEHIPAVYVRISAFADWIEEGICQLSSHPPASCKTVDNISTNESSTANSIIDELDRTLPTEAPTTSSSTTSLVGVSAFSISIVLLEALLIFL